jgi:transcriptional regulator with XRE-family HTH domain
MKKREAVPHDREVGRRIRLRRLELGLSQTALGDGLNLTFQQVQKYENGINRVSAGRLQEIAKLLRVPIAFFFDDFGGSGGGSELSGLMTSAYSLRLLRAFVRIGDRRVQRTTVELLEALAGGYLRRH